jgi:hypothetical protein
MAGNGNIRTFDWISRAQAALARATESLTYSTPGCGPGRRVLRLEGRAVLSMALRTPAGAYLFGGCFGRSASRSFMCFSRKALRSL